MSTYAPMIQKSMGNLDFKNNANNICNLIRGLNPWPGAYFKFDNNIFKVFSCKALFDEKYSFKIPGEILTCDSSGLLIKCQGNSAILITEIQRQGKKRMGIEDFTKGYIFPIGSVIKREEE